MATKIALLPRKRGISFTISHKSLRAWVVSTKSVAWTWSGTVSYWNSCSFACSATLPDWEGHERAREENEEEKQEEKQEEKKEGKEDKEEYDDWESEEEEKTEKEEGALTGVSSETSGEGGGGNKLRSFKE